MFDFLITTPLTNLVIGFYELLGENLGLAIIVFTIVLRFALLPLTMKQIRQQRKMAELQPRLQELQASRKDAKQMSPEEMALMKQTAGSCVGGCLPILIQLPILISLNTIISKIATAQAGDVFNGSLYFDALKHTADYHFNTNFLGIDLAKVPSQVPFGTAFIPFAIIILLLVVTQFIQSRMMLVYQNKSKADAEKQTKKANARKLSKEELEKKKMQEDMQKITQMQMKYLFPLLIGFASYSFTAALGLYWLTQNIFAIVQTDVQNKQLDKELGIKKSGDSKESKKDYRVAEFEDVEKKEDKEVVKKKPNHKKSKKNKNSIKSGKKSKKKK